MAALTRNEKIREAYEDRFGSKVETYKKVNEGIAPKDPGRFSMAEVRKWFLKTKQGP